jgi:ABC-type glycerol-3-phosphate transport system substrate-binding protein
LIQALVDHQKTQLDKAVAAGTLSQAQEDKLAANLQQRITAFVDAKRPATPAMPPRGPGFGFGFVGPAFGGGLWQAAADYLGVPVSTLLGDLRSGESLADVAGKTSGKSASGLIQALVDHQKTQLDKAVAAGTLSQAQEDKLAANLQQRITAFVNAKPRATPAAPPRQRGFGFGFGPPGFGGGRHGGWGTPPSGGATA